MMPKEEFRQRIRAAIWNWLDRLASRIDEHYARLGIPKRQVKRRRRKDSGAGQ